MTYEILYEKLPKKLRFKLTDRIIAIGGLHGVLVVYALFETIKDMILEEQPVSENEVIYIVGHLLLHVFLITTLICGAVKRNHLLVLPWLITSFPVFMIVSFYTFKYSNMYYISQFVVNVIFICFDWFVWYSIYQFFKKCRKLDLRNQNI